MRKLLVASQKGGVGKTTSSMNLAAATALSGSRVLLLDADPISSISASLNLAQHPGRLSLRQAGIDLPGVLCCGVIPGLDVLSPYEDGTCTDEELDELIALIEAPAFQACYGCLIVDSPPFLGANPGQLLAPCNELVLVMRAEALAYRTLPAFLELVQRSKIDSPIKVRGILLTIAEGEKPGGRWERELRGRFGTRILSQVVPHDEQVIKCLMFSEIVTSSSPSSPAAQVYAALAAALGLAAEAPSEPLDATSGLLTAARQRVHSPRQAIGVGLTVVPTPEIPELPPVGDMETTPPVAPSQLQSTFRLRRDPWPSLHDLDFGTDDEAPPARVLPQPAGPPASATGQVAAPSPHGHSAKIQVPTAVWIGLGIFMGAGLSFLQLSPRILPLSVGLAVALFMVLILRVVLLTPEKSQLPLSAPSVKVRGRDSRKPGTPSDGKSNGSRLVALARRVNAARNSPSSDRNRV